MMEFDTSNYYLGVAISRAMDSCKSTGIQPSDHFCEVTKMVELGSGAKRSEVEK